MYQEEYCNYVLTRNPDIKDITFASITMNVPKKRLLESLDSHIGQNISTDKLLIEIIRKYVRGRKIYKDNCDDELKNMLTIQSERRKYLEKIYNDGLPFSYERVFEILIYYIRMLVNRDLCAAQKVNPPSYILNEISEKEFLLCLNRNISLDTIYKVNFDEILGLRENKPLNEETYLRFLILATYQYYKEIENGR